MRVLLVYMVSLFVRLKLKYLMEYIDAACASQLATPCVPMGLIFASKKPSSYYVCVSVLDYWQFCMTFPHPVYI